MRRNRSRIAAATFGVLAAVVVLVGCSAGPVAPPAAPPPAAPGAATPSAAPGAPQTVVSLTFDDGNRTQYTVFPALVDHGMRATFYVNTGLVDRGDASVMTWDQLRRLALAGNDVGGHTRDHLHITQLDAADQSAQVCGDRDRLVAQGFAPVSFAYPFGEHDAVTERLVASCGYRTARITGGLDGPPYADAVTTADPYTLASVTGGDENSTNGPLTLAMLQSAVTGAAAHGGGWVPVVLHQVCEPSDPTYQVCMRSDGPVDSGVFTAFLDWLGTQAPPGTVVEPMSAVPPRP